MDIGVGVYDILNDNFNEKDFKPSSSEPVVRVQGMKNEDMPDEHQSSEDEGGRSDDSNLYYEFNSDEDISEAMSATTKSTLTGQQQKRPMIIDITPPVVVE